jgi:hypothetical protein
MACKKIANGSKTVTDTSLSFTVNDSYNGSLSYTGLNTKPVIKFNFTEPIDGNTINGAIKLVDPSGTNLPLTTTLQNDNKTITVIPGSDCQSFTG